MLKKLLPIALSAALCLPAFAEWWFFSRKPPPGYWQP